MNSLINAFSFLTIIRLKHRGDYNPASYLKYFTLVGLFIGICLAIISYLLNDIYLRPLIMLLFSVVITGGLHLDGFIDTADALFSHRDRNKKLEILKDSRVGAMGLIAATILLIAKYEAFAHLNNYLLITLIPAYSRYAMLYGICFMPYARNEGLGKKFFDNNNKTVLYQILPFVLFMIIFIGLKFTLYFHILFFIAIYLILKFYKFALGGITGDLLGAICEFIEIILLSFSAVFFDI